MVMDCREIGKADAESRNAPNHARAKNLERSTYLGAAATSYVGCEKWVER
jgi:hypothetical protein